MKTEPLDHFQVFEFEDSVSLNKAASYLKQRGFAPEMPENSPEEIAQEFRNVTHNRKGYYALIGVKS